MFHKISQAKYQKQGLFTGIYGGWEPNICGLAEEFIALNWKHQSSTAALNVDPFVQLPKFHVGDYHQAGDELMDLPLCARMREKYHNIPRKSLDPSNSHCSLGEDDFILMSTSNQQV